MSKFIAQYSTAPPYFISPTHIGHIEQRLQLQQLKMAGWIQGLCLKRRNVRDHHAGGTRTIVRNTRDREEIRARYR